MRKRSSEEFLSISGIGKVERNERRDENVAAFRFHPIHGYEDNVFRLFRSQAVPEMATF